MLLFFKYFPKYFRVRAELKGEGKDGSWDTAQRWQSCWHQIKARGVERERKGNISRDRKREREGGRESETSPESERKEKRGRGEKKERRISGGWG